MNFQVPLWPCLLLWLPQYWFLQPFFSETVVTGDIWFIELKFTSGRLLQVQFQLETHFLSNILPQKSKNTDWFTLFCCKTNTFNLFVDRVLHSHWRFSTFFAVICSKIGANSTRETNTQVTREHAWGNIWSSDKTHASSTFSTFQIVTYTSIALFSVSLSLLCQLVGLRSTHEPRRSSAVAAAR